MIENTSSDIRWLQRFDNFKKANARLSEAVILFEDSTDMSFTQVEMIKEALVQRFEYTWELAWNVIRDFAIYQGREEFVNGPRDAVRMGVHLELIDQGDLWMEMLKNRNLMSHTYDEATADKVVKLIVEHYKPAMERFEQQMGRRIASLETEL